MKSKKTLSIRSLTVFDVLCLFVLFTFTEEFIKWLMFKFVWIPTVPSMQSPPSKTSQVKVVDGLQNTSRGQYGGGSDAIHLGGWTKQPDFGGLSNNTFNFLLGIIGIKSFLDVGCGRGISTSYFLNKGADVLCVEGSHEAISQSLLPPNKIVEHDYSLGPWWPSKTYDACWSVEFVEHVPRHYIRNYMSTFQQCALLFVSRSQWGGWSHVEIHQEWWWISRFRVHSFVFDRELTEIIRSHAEADKRASDKTLSKENQVKNQLGQHIRATMMVASLQRHDHLFAGNGCFNGIIDNADGGKPCANETFPPEYIPLMNCVKSHREIKKKRYSEILWDCQQQQNVSISSGNISTGTNG